MPVVTGIGQNINVTYDPIAQTLRNSLIPTTSETSIDLVRNADSTTNVVIGVMSVNPVDLFDISWAVLKNGGSTILLRNANDPNDPSIRWPALPDMSCSPWCLFASYSHDPVVRATGLPGQVAMSVIAESNLGTNDIALAISNDGGEHFTKVKRISTGVSGSGTDPNLTWVDQPVIAVDPPSAYKALPDVWVWWRNSDANGNLRSWLCKTTISTSGDTTACDDPSNPLIEITSSITEGGAGYPPGPAPPPAGRGATINTGVTGSVSMVIVPFQPPDIAATVYLSFPSLLPNPNAHSCAFNDKDTVTWRLAWSQSPARGQDAWFTNTLTKDTNWPYCIVPNAPTPQRSYVANHNRGQIAYDDRAQAILVSLERSAKQENSFDLGTRALLTQTTIWRQSDSDPMGQTNLWMPFCFGNQVRLVGDPNLVPPGDTFCRQFFSSVAVALTSEGNRVAWTWHDTRSDIVTPKDQLFGASLRAGWTNGIPITTIANTMSPVASGANVPTAVPPLRGTHNTYWGDYEGLAGDRFSGGGQFWSVWADYRTGRSAQWGSSTAALTDIQAASFLP